MFLTTLLCAAALRASVAGQGRVVQLEQESLPFLRNGSTGLTFTSPIGELKHIQTLRLENETSDLLDFTSIIVTRGGSELLAISVNEEESSADFVTLALQPTGGGRYNILQATINPMLGPNGQPLVILEAPSERIYPTLSYLEYLIVLQRAASGVAVDGRYRDRGRGDLTIGLHSAGSELSRALRFRRGVRSVSTGLDVSDLINACKEPDSLPAAAISYLNRLRGFRGDLLAICSEPLIDSPIPRVNPTADIYSGGVYNDRDGIRRFFVESTDGHQPSAVAQLRNGDIMIAFVRGGDVEDEAREMMGKSDGKVCSAQNTDDVIVVAFLLSPAQLKFLSLWRDIRFINDTVKGAFAAFAGHCFGSLFLPVARRRCLDRFNIAVQSGLAVREDINGRIFVYSMSDDFFVRRLNDDHS
ncbi:hypothetical protein FOZ60_014684 [Perkinsus olseni]|uniref:Uncharacterized protein n=1 Tax=Perkinsus olseni TaxID=32597 RepID=A0A7J6PLV7_PEROL|nr:hypothetical protein FOZ60_014684 [Perkinsus olseni]